MKKAFAIAVLILVSFIAITAQPAPRGERGMCGSKEMNFKHMMMEKLNLTDEQKDNIQNIHLNLEKEIVDLKANIQKNRIELKQLMIGDKLNKNDITALIVENNEIQGKIKKLKIDNWFKIYSQLDDSQKSIFKKSFGRMMNEMKMHKGGGHRMDFHKKGMPPREM
jgi:Spy/CpxP family protein refolding chaperone